MANGDIHTVPHERGWANRIEGGARVSSIHPTRTEAQRRGREMAFRRKVEHLIYNQRGSITERNSYGNDLPVAHPRVSWPPSGNRARKPPSVGGGE